MIDYSSSCPRAAIDRFDEFGRHASDHCVRRHIFGNDRACRNDRSLPHANAIRDDRAGSQPDIILDDDAFCRDALVDERASGIIEHMIDRDDLRERRGVHAITDLHAALPADYRIFADQAVAADLDTRMRHVAEVIDVQHRTMHDDAPRADLDPLRAGMQIDTFIEIRAMPQPDVIRKPQADAALDRRRAVHAQDQAIEDPAQSYPDDGRYPAKQEHNRLFEHVAKQRRCLTVKIETNAAQHGL